MQLLPCLNSFKYGANFKKRQDILLKKPIMMVVVHKKGAKGSFFILKDLIVR